MIIDPEKTVVLLIDILPERGIVKSRNEVRRLIAQGAITVDGQKATSLDEGILLSDFIKRGDRGIDIRIGKKRIHNLRIRRQVWEDVLELKLEIKQPKETR